MCFPRVASVVLLAASLGSPPSGVAAEVPGPGQLVRRVADGHPIQYWVSLPKQWSASRDWPVVVVLEAAEKEYEVNARRFADARGDRPFIIVAPYIVSNGNQGLRDPRIFPYSAETWDLIDRLSPCAFDLAGIDAVIATVRRDFQGKSRVYLTGFEAGAHALWAYTFRHPEKLAGVVPVAGNYRGRCVDEASMSTDPARDRLPIHALTGSLDPAFGAGGPLHGQFVEAANLARQHGFNAISEGVIPGKDHVPLPVEVLAYFATLEQAK
ncbi:MAG TPA: hypothetical protein VG734_05560 [Lacunisphaera sp.]|nr:hypothetical protein [Lacunisphaera sp.]